MRCAGRHDRHSGKRIPAAALIAAVCAAFLVASTPAGSADNQGAVIRHLRSQVLLLKQQRDSARAQLAGVRVNLKQAKTDLATAKMDATNSSASLATAQGQVTTLAASLAAAQASIANGGLSLIAGMNADQAWAALPSLALRMPSVGPLCGYSQTHFIGTSFEEWSFDKYAAC